MKNLISFTSQSNVTARFLWLQGTPETKQDYQAAVEIKKGNFNTQAALEALNKETKTKIKQKAEKAKKGSDYVVGPEDAAMGLGYIYQKIKGRVNYQASVTFLDVSGKERFSLPLIQASRIFPGQSVKIDESGNVTVQDGETGSPSRKKEIGKTRTSSIKTESKAEAKKPPVKVVKEAGETVEALKPLKISADALKKEGYILKKESQNGNIQMITFKEVGGHTYELKFNIKEQEITKIIDTDTKKTEPLMNNLFHVRNGRLVYEDS